MLPGAAVVVGVAIADAIDSACSALHFVYIICMMYVFATVHQLRHVIDLCSNAGYLSVNCWVEICVDPNDKRCRFALH